MSLCQVTDHVWSSSIKHACSCVVQLLFVIGTEVGKKPDALVTLLSGCWQGSLATS